MSTTPDSEATRNAVGQRYAGIARDTMAVTAEAGDQLLCPELLREQRSRCHDPGNKHWVCRRGTESPPHRGECGSLLRQPHGHRRAATG
jgi:hypothetical protein